MCVNIIMAMYERSHVNLKVEGGSSFAFIRELSYNVSNLFKHVKLVKAQVHTHVKITPKWRSTFIRMFEGCSEKAITRYMQDECGQEGWVTQLSTSASQ